MEKVNEIVAEYGAWLNSWASVKTTKARTTLAAALVREYGVKGLTATNIQAWLAGPSLTDPGKPRSRWTKATYHAHLKDFCAWLVATGHLQTNPMGDVHKPARPHSLPRPLSEAEVARALEVATGRTRDWILLALLSGLRAHEIAKIRGEDVTAEGIYVEGKGGVRASIPTHPDLWAMARRYPRVGYWFPGRGGGPIGSHAVTVGVGKLFDDLGIEGSIHRCRHVYGTRLLRAGVNIRKVQRLMRHASLNTTAVYTAVDEDELREAINRLTA